jgi:hypothetical protein
MGEAGPDSGLAGAPDLYLEFPQGRRVAGEVGNFVERNLKVGIRQIFQHAKHIELGFILWVFNLFDVDAPEPLA